MAGITVSTTGPFFDHGKRTLDEALKETVATLLKEAEAKTNAQLYLGHGVITGEYKRSIHSRFQSSFHGIVEEDRSDKGKVLERGRYWKSTGHRFKGYGAFRKGAQHARRVAKEMAGKVYKKAVKRLT